MTNDAPAAEPSADPSAPAAAELQDQLLMVCNDLDRLQRLLAGASDTLLQRFQAAASRVDALSGQGVELGGVRDDLDGAITALQFQDAASQLIMHTLQRLHSCADRLARDAMGDDEDGQAAVVEPPSRPNPVTQDEMDAGSIELF